MYVYYRGTDRNAEIEALHSDADIETPTGILWLTDGREIAERYGDNIVRIVLNRPLPDTLKGIAEHELGNHREWKVPAAEWNDKFSCWVDETESWHANGDYRKEV
jgi:hypothetical protein